MHMHGTSGRICIRSDTIVPIGSGNPGKAYKRILEIKGCYTSSHTQYCTYHTYSYNINYKYNVNYKVTCKVGVTKLL